MKGLTSLWYSVQSIPSLLFAIIFLCAVIFVYIAPFFPQLKFLGNRWIGLPIVFILTIPFSFNLSKFMDYSHKAGISKEADKKKLQKQLELAKTDNKILRTENENLKHAALNVQRIFEMEEINFISTNMISTIAHTENIENEPNLIGNGSHGTQFWLVSQYNLNGVKYGIDLRKVKLILKDNVIHVYGVNPKYNGSEDESIKDVLCEIRKYDSNDGVLTNERVLYDKASSEKKNELKEKYHSIDKGRIKNTTDEFEWINTLVENNAKEYLKTFLLPVSNNIVFEDRKTTIPAKAVSLKEFYQNYFVNGLIE